MQMNPGFFLLNIHLKYFSVSDPLAKIKSAGYYYLKKTS